MESHGATCKTSKKCFLNLSVVVRYSETKQKKKIILKFGNFFGFREVVVTKVQIAVKRENRYWWEITKNSLRHRSIFLEDKSKYLSSHFIKLRNFTLFIKNVRRKNGRDNPRQGGGVGRSPGWGFISSLSVRDGCEELFTLTERNANVKTIFASVFNTLCRLSFERCSIRLKKKGWKFLVLT